MTTSSAGGSVAYAIPITQVFDAPRELVFRQWVDAEDVRTWFAPDGYTVTRCELDARPGGLWHVTYESDAGEVHYEYGEFREVVAPERLVFTLTQKDGRRSTGPETLVTVVFVAKGARTEMSFRQMGYHSAAMRDGNAEGWGECFRKLGRHLAESGQRSPSPNATAGSDEDSRREIRALYEAWWRAAAAKDIDGTMAPIAKDVVSYEHEAPLEYRGIDAVRAVCQAGFDAMTGDLRWDVPDLQIVVRGDLAVTWGINHMRAQEPGREMVELWSRGTRVFRKIDGSWEMIHQHVSYPRDPSTGEAWIDIAPER